jgi:quercetin dioxygenase-like cupin family protein
MQSGHALYALAQEEGQALWFLNCLTFVKATGEQTGGAFGLIEQTIPAGFASPYHVHRAEDETFYILEGEATFLSGDRKIKATAGSYLFLPRDIPHGFRVDAPTRLLILTTPAGFEQFVIEMSEPATDLSTSPSSPPDMDKLMRLAAKYQIGILGPLPE